MDNQTQPQPPPKHFQVGLTNEATTVQLESLRLYFTSASKYIHIWNGIKSYGLLTVGIPKDSSFDTLRDAVKRLKLQDHYFKVYCELSLGYQYHLDIEDYGHSMMFKLCDTQDTLNEINYL
jgi:hypothetical protein